MIIAVIGAGIVIIINIVAILDCLETNRDFAMRLIWILIIIFFPLFGALAYFLAGFPTGHRKRGIP